MECQSAICEREYGVERKLIRDDKGLRPACVDKMTGEVIRDIYPGCWNVYGECPIHKRQREQSAGLK